MGQSPKDTSWEQSARWYDEHLAGDDTYHAQVLLPNVLRFAAPEQHEAVLDLACGQGFFTRPLSTITPHTIGTDLSPSLIAEARSKGDSIHYEVADARTLSFAKDAQFDLVVCVLALQNMTRVGEVFAEVKRVLKPTGRFIFVLNHPAFRIPGASAWAFDEQTATQYRRVDAYLSSRMQKIAMHPGLPNKEETASFHLSLQDLMKALRGAGLAITALEEWISHRQSQPGPRAKAEDRARKEFPLFMAIEVRPFRQ